jgi:hypothetical protein
MGVARTSLIHPNSRPSLGTAFCRERTRQPKSDALSAVVLCLPMLLVAIASALMGALFTVGRFVRRRSVRYRGFLNPFDASQTDKSQIAEEPSFCVWPPTSGTPTAGWTGIRRYTLRSLRKRRLNG